MSPVRHRRQSARAMWATRAAFVAPATTSSVPKIATASS
jgi:hypothetical protein